MKTPAADPLAALIDIPLPREVSLWPQTWPLRIAIVLIVAATVLAIWRFVHRFRANRYRREALAELERIGRAAGGLPDQVATRLSVLLRRTALAAFPRETVAPLAGTACRAQQQFAVTSTTQPGRPLQRARPRAQEAGSMKGA